MRRKAVLALGNVNQKEMVLLLVCYGLTVSEVRYGKLTLINQWITEELLLASKLSSHFGSDDVIPMIQK